MVQERRRVPQFLTDIVPVLLLLVRLRRLYIIGLLQLVEVSLGSRVHFLQLFTVHCLEDGVEILLLDVLDQGSSLLVLLDLR